jgi:hypothetical protein
MAGDNELSGLTPGGVRNLLILALLSSLGSTGISFVGTNDRYTGEDADRDRRLIYKDIQRLEERIQHEKDSRKLLEQVVKDIDENHPPRELVATVRDVVRKQQEMELREARRESREKN